MRKRQYPNSRPDDFDLNTNSVLAQGLVFAGLGRFVGSTHYHDSSLYKNNGTLTGYAGAGNTPADKWQWDATLRRWMLGFKYPSGNMVVTGKSLSGVAGTWGFWIYPTYKYSNQIILSDGNWAADINGVNVYNTTTAFGIETCGSATRTAITSASGTLITAWTHCLFTWNATVSQSYVNGLASGAPGTNPVAPTPAYNFHIGQGGDESNYWNPNPLADVLCWNRVLSPAEIQTLADPSNVMLSGLILPPRRRLFGVVAGGAPATYTLAAAAGSVVESGTAASLLRSRVVSAVGATYVQSGTAAGLLGSRAVTATSGGYTESGSVAGLFRSRVVAAGIASYSESGSAASLLHHRVASAAGGEYAVAGSAVSLRMDRIIAAALGQYSLTGTAAALTKSGTYSLLAESGGSSVSGTAAGLLCSRIVVSGAGTFVESGAAASLLVSHRIDATAAAYAHDGKSVTLTYTGGVTQASSALLYYHLFLGA